MFMQQLSNCFLHVANLLITEIVHHQQITFYNAYENTNFQFISYVLCLSFEQNLSQQDLGNPPDIEIIDFQPIPSSPFRLFGSQTTSSPTGKKLSTTDKVRRKRTPKLDEQTDGQKVKRRKSDMNMKQPDISVQDKKSSTDSSLKISSNYREIGFSPVSSAQSDSCSNSNHTSESSNISTVNSKQTQVNRMSQTKNSIDFFFRSYSD